MELSDCNFMEEDIKKQIEFGDFQTPGSLSNRVSALFKNRRYETIVEPNCGVGNFLISGACNLPGTKFFYGFDIDKKYTAKAKKTFKKLFPNKNISIQNQDFFLKDWNLFFKEIKKPILVIGNPPWVTNSKLGQLKGANLPKKTNFLKHGGFDALTGKSNFDISEWMLIKLADSLAEKEATLAMIVKSGVARKVLKYCWSNNINISNASIYFIDAKAEFDVSVDACVLVCDFAGKKQEKICNVFENIESRKPIKTIGYSDEKVVADIYLYEKNRKIFNTEKPDKKWRSGIKHDASKIMELTKLSPGLYVNGLGEEIKLEDKYLYPLLKSSDVHNKRKPRRWTIITQKKVGEDTSVIKKDSPNLWKYLNKHSEVLNRRSSSIYKNRPPFSIFGVGDYTFMPWKIAISGFYKTPVFSLIGKHEGKLVMVDDTVNFLPFSNKEEAVKALKYLESKSTNEAINSVIFWDNKRPVTVELLNSIKV